MKNYVIVAPQYTHASAGIRAMYKLNEDLNKFGYTSRVLLFPKELKNNVESNEIVIYPDSLVGNPLKSNKVVRLLFMFAGYFGEDKDFPKDEYMYYYSPEFILNNRNPENILTIPIIDESRFPYKSVNERSGTCYLSTKYEDYFKLKIDKSTLPNDCTKITIDTNLSDLFSRVQTLITYDDSSINIEALLAGIKVEFRFNEKFPKLQTLGGFDYSNVVESYKQLRRNYLVQLQQFVQRTQERFYDKKNA